MFVNRKFPSRITALILCCLIGHTGCDVFGIGEMITGYKNQPDEASFEKPAAFAKSISIVNPPKQLQVDKPHPLLAIISDSNDVRILDATTLWESSDPKIVSIDNDGQATAHRPGSVTISANFARLTDSFTLKAVDEIPHSIIFDKQDIEADELDVFTLTTTVKNRFDEVLDIPVKMSAENTRLLRFRKDGTILARTPGLTHIHAVAGDLKESVKIRIEPIGQEAYRRKAAQLYPPTPEEKAAEDAQAAAAAQESSALKLAQPKSTAKP